MDLLQRRSNKTDQRMILRLIEVVQAELQRARLDVQTEGAKEPIPKREQRRIVRIGLRLPSRMVHLVHERRHDKDPQTAVQPRWQRNVRVVQLDHREHRQLVKCQFPQFHAQHGDNGHP